MRIFFNDTPLILLKPSKDLDRENFQIILKAGEKPLVSEKLYLNVLITDVENQHVGEIITMLRKNVFHKVSSITMKAADYHKVKNHIKSGFKIVMAAGGIVRKGDKILLIRRLKKWDLPKGKLDDGESMPGAAVREVEEECGIKVKLGDKICNSWHTYSMNGKNILKKTSWYSMQCEDDSNMTPQLEENIEDVKWLKTRDLFHALKDSYQSIQWVFEKYWKKTKAF